MPSKKPSRNTPTDRRKVIRNIEKGHHMAPRQNVTSKRKGSSARGGPRKRSAKST